MRRQEDQSELAASMIGFGKLMWVVPRDYPLVPGVGEGFFIDLEDFNADETPIPYE